MSATGQPWHVGLGQPLLPVTVRRTRDGRVAHLFVEYQNGAVSGTPVAFCEQARDSTHRLSLRTGWHEATAETLCNRCGRAFHRQRRKWRGSP